MKSTASLKSIEKTITIADYLLLRTYPVVKDPKILLSVLTNINEAYMNLIDLILAVIPTKLGQVKPATFETKFHKFKGYLQKNKNVTNDEFKSILFIHDLINIHHQSTVEFSKKDELIICVDDYSLKKITSERLEIHLAFAKKLIKKIFDKGEE